MSSSLPRKDWRKAPARKALTPTQVVSGLSDLNGWVLVGSGEDIAIEKHFHFANYFETMAFVNAVAYIAHVEDHHPDLLVGYNRCTVRLATHDVKGISKTDLECAALVEALLTSKGAA